MNQNSNIQKLVNETLESLDGIQRAEPKPFLFTRVMVRMNQDQDSVWEKLASLISKPAIAFASVLLFITINLFVLFRDSENATSVPQESTLIAGNEFDLSVTTFYDINPEQNDIAQK